MLLQWFKAFAESQLAISEARLIYVRLSFLVQPRYSYLIYGYKRSSAERSRFPTLEHVATTHTSVQLLFLFHVWMGLPLRPYPLSTYSGPQQQHQPLTLSLSLLCACPTSGNSLEISLADFQ